MPKPRVSVSLAAALLIGGCATVASPPGPVVSPTGIVYEPGIPPEETRFSQTARLYIVGLVWERALGQSLLGIASDSTNPVHYYLAGASNVGLGDYASTDRFWREAERLYPAYELVIDPLRESAWADSFNDGVELYLDGQIDEAVAAWEKATVIYDRRPEVHLNLGTVLADEGEYRQAIQAYREGLQGLARPPATYVMDEEEVQARSSAQADMELNLAQLLLLQDEFSEAETLLRRRLEANPRSVELTVSLGTALNGQGRQQEAADVYGTLLASQNLTTYQLTQIGTSLFHAQDFVGSGEAFRRVTQLEPDGRDGWFNYANVLLARGEWETLRVAGARLVELDPLSESSALINARSHVEVGDEPAARAGLERLESLPVLFEDLQLGRTEGDTRVRGTVVGHAAPAGTPIRVRFLFYSGRQQVGEELVQLVAPDAEVSSPFSVALEVAFEGFASAYRYVVLDPAPDPDPSAPPDSDAADTDGN